MSIDNDYIYRPSNNCEAHNDDHQGFRNRQYDLTVIRRLIQFY